MPNKSQILSLGIATLALSTLISGISGVYQLAKWSGSQTNEILTENSKKYALEDMATHDYVQNHIHDKFEVYQQEFKNEKISLGRLQDKTENLLSNKNIEKYINKHGSDEDKKALEDYDNKIKGYKEESSEHCSNALACFMMTGLSIYGIRKAGKAMDKENEKEDSEHTK